MEFYKSALGNKKKFILFFLLALLVLGNIFFGVKYVLAWQEAKNVEQQLRTQQADKRVVNFLNLFIEKVLKTDREVSFEDRLQLENAVRDINDPEILAKWEAFTGGTTVEQLQQSVKELLEVLVKKIYS